LSEKRRQNEELSLKLSDERDESASLKKKHAANLKDLTRQLQSLQKKQTTAAAAAVVANSSSSPSTNTSASMSLSASINNQETYSHNVAQQKAKISRENSISSLTDHVHLTDHYNNNDDTHSLSLDSNHSLTAGGGSSRGQHQQHQQNRYEHEVTCDGLLSPVDSDVYVVDIDKQKLIEKIVKLQRKLAKSNEKIDFLQDHVNQLTTDLKRKTRIIQAYAIKEDTGAFTSEAHDAIKVGLISNKDIRINTSKFS
jgi:hypothetical protein